MYHRPRDQLNDKSLPKHCFQHNLEKKRDYIFEVSREVTLPTVE